MRILTLTSACLVCTGLGQRIPTAREPLLGIASEKPLLGSAFPSGSEPKLLQSSGQVSKVNQFRAFASVLASFNPAGGHGPHLQVKKADSHRVAVRAPHISRSDIATFNAAESSTANDSFHKSRRLSRREAVIKALLVGVATSGLASTQTQPAFAATNPLFTYNIVALGNITQKIEREKELSAILKAKNFSDDQLEKYQDDKEVVAAWSEQKQVAGDIVSLKKNSAVVQRYRQDIAAGNANLTAVLAFTVPNISAAVRFWTEGVRCVVLDTRLVDGKNVTNIGFGPVGVRGDDGAKFNLELTEDRSKPLRFNETENGFQYLQLGIPSLRLSKIYENLGTIRSAYGWNDILAPDGVPVRIKIDSSRRDPFQWVAWRVSNLAKAEKFFKSIGMTTISKEDAKPKKGFDQKTFQFYEESAYDAFEPEREKGAIRMGFGSDATNSFGLFLLGAKKAAKPINTPATLRIISSQAGGTTAEFEGLKLEFVSPEEYL